MRFKKIDKMAQNYVNYAANPLGNTSYSAYLEAYMLLQEPRIIFSSTRFVLIVLPIISIIGTIYNNISAVILPLVTILGFFLVYACTFLKSNILKKRIEYYTNKENLNEQV